MACFIINVGGAQQGLGGNTASVQAGAAQLVLFYQSGRIAVLTKANGALIAAGAAADHDHIKLFHFYFSVQPLNLKEGLPDTPGLTLKTPPARGYSRVSVKIAAVVIYNSSSASPPKQQDVTLGQGKSIC